jgi:hypothetical protein
MMLNRSKLHSKKKTRAAENYKHSLAAGTPRDISNCQHLSYGGSCKLYNLENVESAYSLSVDILRIAGA